MDIEIQRLLSLLDKAASEMISYGEKPHFLILIHVKIWESLF